VKYLEKQLFLVIALCFIYSVRSFADDPMKVGKAALDRGDYIAAINAFRDATQDDKKNSDAFYYLGVACYKADSADQAVAALVQGRELDPNNPKFYDLLGDVYMKQHITAGAIEQYTKATTLDSTNPAIFLKLAEALRKNRLYSEAVRGYLSVIKLDSMNSVALTQMGNIYFRAKQWDKALPIYIRLAKLEPDSLNIQIKYVTVLSENGYWKDILPVADWILQRDPSNSGIQTIQAEAIAKTGNAKIAIDKYRNLNLDSLKVEDLTIFARMLKSASQFDSAIIIYQLILKRDSTRCDVPYDLGTTYMRLKQYANAVKMFEKKIACDTSIGYQFASSLNAAMSLMQLKDFSKAKEYIKKSLQLKPENVQTWNTMAQCNLQLGDVDEAITGYKKVIELIADDPEGKYSDILRDDYRTVGVEYLILATKAPKEDAKKTYLLALEYLKKALTFNAKDCQLLLWTGQAAQNSNNKEEAKKYYCKVLSQCAKTSKEAKDAQNGLDVLGVTCNE
jgi:tetratricopeptide (TPR) repeat protein